MPEFLPWCSTAEVVESSDEHMVASVGVAKGAQPALCYAMSMVPGKSIEMNLQEGPFTQLHGVWVFKALTEQACKISLDLSFDYAGPIVRATLGPSVQSGRQYPGRRVLSASQATACLRLKWCMPAWIARCC